MMAGVGSSLFSNRRRENVAGGRSHAHQVKVNAEEEALLRRLALEREVSVPRMLVELAIAEDRGVSPTQRTDILARMFVTVEQLRKMATNINQIARATNAGAPITDELHHTLAAAEALMQRANDVIDQLAVA